MPFCKVSVGSSTPPLLFLDLRTHGGGIKWPRAGAILADNYSLAWRTMDAQHWGVPQRRLRISLVLDLTGQRAGEILFEPESLRGHFAPSVTPGQAAPATVGGCTDDADCTDAIPVNLQIATRHKALGERTGLGIGQAGDAAYTLQEGHEHGVCCPDIQAYTLKIRSGCDGGGKGPLVQTEKSATLSTLQDQTLFVADALPFDTTQITSPQNGSNPHFGDPCHPLAATAHPPAAVCETVFAEQDYSTYKESACTKTLKASGGNFGGGSESIVAEPRIYDARGNGDGQTSPTITGDHNSRVTDYTAIALDKIVRWIVRRLTPTECERLQGYPDGWTDLGDWVDSKGKTHKAADTPRYKALGNSIALPQWYYVLGGIADRLPEDATLGSLFDGIGGFPYVWAQLHGGQKQLCVWASEIEEFPIAVTKKWFPEVEDGKLC